MSAFARSTVGAFVGALCLSSFGLVASAPQASAQPQLINGFGGPAGYGVAPNCLGPNDDGSSTSISLASVFPQGLNFFGRVHQNMFVNTNGNITFNASLSTYTPRSFPIASQPMIAPYWGDIDIRSVGGTCTSSEATTCHSPTENGVWWHLQPSTESSNGRIVITWDRVQYFSCGDENPERRMNFQLILTRPPTCGEEGDFDVEFRYNRCEWESGGASEGDGTGFGGTEAQAGFDAGDQTNYVAIPGSLEAGIAQRLCTTSNVGIPGIWRFRIRGGQVQCPDAGTPCAVSGQVGSCASGVLQCSGSDRVCQQVAQPIDEVCDGADNDCNGTVDDGQLCPSGLVCSDGACRTPCAESFCPAGESCADNGRCVETACLNVTCQGGTRCVGGTCVPPCDNVVCPDGQTCREGTCKDACAGITCDDCTVCNGGVCVLPCVEGGCGLGEVCGTSGRCESRACAGVVCRDEKVCRDGQCVEACEGIRCPIGQGCFEGECVRNHLIPQTDAGVDAGPIVILDSGRDVGVDSGTAQPNRASSCGCRIESKDEQGARSFGFLSALFGIFLIGRRSLKKRNQNQSRN